MARAAEERPGVPSHQEIGAVNLEIAVPAENRLVRFAKGPRRKLAQLAVLHLWQRTQSPALVLRFLLSFSLIFSRNFSLSSLQIRDGVEKEEKGSLVLLIETTFLFHQNDDFTIFS